ncbi:MAG: hypothetical protein ACKO32_16640 [Planctomycetia bacterium]
MRRAIERHIEDPLAEELLRTSFSGKDRITVIANEAGDGLAFQHHTRETPQPTQT